jgi:hypothetical protein
MARDRSAGPARQVTRDTGRGAASPNRRLASGQAAGRDAHPVWRPALPTAVGRRRNGTDPGGVGPADER